MFSLILKLRCSGLGCGAGSAQGIRFRMWAVGPCGFFRVHIWGISGIWGLGFRCRGVKPGGYTTHQLCLWLQERRLLQVEEAILFMGSYNP